MQKRSSKKKSKDVNVIASKIVQETTGEELVPREDGKNIAAVALGKLGGLKGGKARAEKLTSARRVEIAKKAAMARWGKV